MRQNLNRPQAHGKSSPPDPQDNKPWLVVTDLDFLDARLNPMSPSTRHLYQVLDGFCRMNPFCWPDNATLTDWTNMESRTLQQGLAKLEEAGAIACVYSDPKKRHRLGIIMRRRVGPGTPAADTPERLAIAEEAVRAAWRPTENDSGYWMRRLGFAVRGNPRSSERTPEPCARKSAHTERGNPRSPERGNPRQNKDVTVEENEVKKDLNSREGDSILSFNGNDQTADATPSAKSESPPLRIGEAPGRADRLHGEVGRAEGPKQPDGLRASATRPTWRGRFSRTLACPLLRQNEPRGSSWHLPTSSRSLRSPNRSPRPSTGR